MAPVRNEIDAILAARREKAAGDLEERKAEVYARIPQLMRIDEDIAIVGVRFAQSLIRQKSDMCADALTMHINNLNSEKEQLLKAHGFSADYLKPRYTCEFCNDTGIRLDYGTLDSRPCSCYRQLYIERIYRVSNILNDGEAGFEFFQDTYYSDIPDKGRYDSEVSPKAQINGIKNHCLAFIEQFDIPKTRNMYFWGRAGTGKTFMAKSIGLELLRKGYTVLYLSAPTLFEVIRNARYASEKDNSDYNSSYRDLLNVQLLILDDLGTEPASDARSAELLTLLEARRSRPGLHTVHTIISSNLDMKRLYQAYNQRIASRIAGEFETLQFFGDDIRILKKYK